MRAWLSFVMVSAVFAGCAASGEGEEAFCEPGSQQVCACESIQDFEGLQSCDPATSTWGECLGCPTTHPCEGLDCTQHGECVLEDNQAVCVCEEGYHVDGLTCLSDSCNASCDGRACGDDGCGGSCGSCEDKQTCLDGACVCEPDCLDRLCGDDGCGGSCGSCELGMACTQDGQCAPVEEPVCEGRECGDDGQGGSCGECLEGTACDASGQCVCVPQCGDQNCGDDGCGGVCGVCGHSFVCVQGHCEPCSPDCEGRECGGDGCGGSCGECLGGLACSLEGQCEGNLSGSCAGWCGEEADGCYCDDYCFENGDCCFDVCQACPELAACSGGYCSYPEIQDCNGNCALEYELGDGVCDDYFACDDLYWDYGDCEVLCADDQKPNCWGSCSVAALLGDGICNDEFDCLEYEWDHSDCIVTCADDELVDCWNWCMPKSQWGDGSCDYSLECEALNWDNGDCSPPSNSCDGFCGTGAGYCYCDLYCEEAGDCCEDVCDFCPSLPMCGCVSDCAGKECGDDGCMGDCGWCDYGSGCDDSGLCVPGLCAQDEVKGCDLSCVSPDWIGDGYCDDSLNCETFQFDGGDCVPCVPDCQGKICGSDGCNGSCGDCPDAEVCLSNACTQPVPCSKVYDCATGCIDAMSEDCLWECIEAGTQTAQDLALNLLYCLFEAGLEDCAPEDLVCQEQVKSLCQTELDACLNDGAPLL